MLLSKLSCPSIFPPVGSLLGHSVLPSCLVSPGAPALWFFILTWTSSLAKWTGMWIN